MIWDYKQAIDDLFVLIMEPLSPLKDVDNKEEFFSYIDGLDAYYSVYMSNYIADLFQALAQLRIDEEDFNQDDFFERLHKRMIDLDSIMVAYTNHPSLGHPDVTTYIRSMYRSLMFNIRPYISQISDSDGEGNFAPLSYMFIQSYSSRMLENIWVTNYKQKMAPISFLTDEQFNLNKGWLQYEMVQNMIASDIARRLGYATLYYDLNLRYCKIPTFGGLSPQMGEELCKTAPDHDLDYMLKTLETCNNSIIKNLNKHTSESELTPVYQDLLHLCREIRSYFQLYYEMFQDETDWTAAIIKAESRRMMDGDEIPRNYLALLEENQIIGGHGKPFDFS